MIKLVIKYRDDRPDWIVYFNNMEDAQAWASEEQAQKYWDFTNIIDIEDLTPPEVIPDSREILAAKWAALRKARNAALTACDWCMLPDAPLDREQKAIVANYRNSLRRLPENSHDPDQLSIPDFPKL